MFVLKPKNCILAHRHIVLWPISANHKHQFKNTNTNSKTQTPIQKHKRQFKNTNANSNTQTPIQPFFIILLHLK